MSTLAPQESPAKETLSRAERPLPESNGRSRLTGNYFFRQALVVGAFVLIWGLWVEWRNVNPLLVPSPLAVARAFVELGTSGALTSYTVVTMKLLLTGIGIGVSIAFVFTGLAIFFPAVRTVLVTLAAMFIPLPSVALLPL